MTSHPSLFIFSPLLFIKQALFSLSELPLFFQSLSLCPSRKVVLYPVAVLNLLKQLLWNVNHNFNLYRISILINLQGFPVLFRCFLLIVTEEMTFWLIKFVSAAELSKL